MRRGLQSSLLLNNRVQVQVHAQQSSTAKSTINNSAARLSISSSTTSQWTNSVCSSSLLLSHPSKSIHKDANVMASSSPSPHMMRANAIHGGSITTPPTITMIQRRGVSRGVCLRAEDTNEAPSDVSRRGDAVLGEESTMCYSTCDSNLCMVEKKDEIRTTAAADTNQNQNEGEGAEEEEPFPCNYLWSSELLTAACEQCLPCVLRIFDRPPPEYPSTPPRLVPFPAPDTCASTGVANTAVGASSRNASGGNNNSNSSVSKGINSSNACSEFENSRSNSIQQRGSVSVSISGGEHSKKGIAALNHHEEGEGITFTRQWLFFREGDDLSARHGIGNPIVIYVDASNTAVEEFKIIARKDESTVSDSLGGSSGEEEEEALAKCHNSTLDNDQNDSNKVLSSTYDLFSQYTMSRRLLNRAASNGPYTRLGVPRAVCAALDKMERFELHWGKECMSHRRNSDAGEMAVAAHSHAESSSISPNRTSTKTVTASTLRGAALRRVAEEEVSGDDLDYDGNDEPFELLRVVLGFDGGIVADWFPCNFTKNTTRREGPTLTRRIGRKEKDSAEELNELDKAKKNSASSEGLGLVHAQDGTELNGLQTLSTLTMIAYLGGALDSTRRGDTIRGNYSLSVPPPPPNAKKSTDPPNSARNDASSSTSSSSIINGSSSPLCGKGSGGGDRDGRSVEKGGASDLFSLCRWANLEMDEVAGGGISEQDTYTATEGPEEVTAAASVVTSQSLVRAWDARYVAFGSGSVEELRTDTTTANTINNDNNTTAIATAAPHPSSSSFKETPTTTTESISCSFSRQSLSKKLPRWMRKQAAEIDVSAILAAERREINIQRIRFCSAFNNYPYRILTMEVGDDGTTPYVPNLVTIASDTLGSAWEELYAHHEHFGIPITEEEVSRVFFFESNLPSGPCTSSPSLSRFKADPLAVMSLCEAILSAYVTVAPASIGALLLSGPSASSSQSSGSSTNRTSNSSIINHSAERKEWQQQVPIEDCREPCAMTSPKKSKVRGSKQETESDAVAAATTATGSSSGDIAKSHLLGAAKEGPTQATATMLLTAEKKRFIKDATSAHSILHAGLVWCSGRLKEIVEWCAGPSTFSDTEIVRTFARGENCRLVKCVSRTTKSGAEGSKRDKEGGDYFSATSTSYSSREGDGLGNSQSLFNSHLLKEMLVENDFSLLRDLTLGLRLALEVSIASRSAVRDADVWGPRDRDVLQGRTRSEAHVALGVSYLDDFMAFARDSGLVSVLLEIGFTEHQSLAGGHQRGLTASMQALSVLSFAALFVASTPTVVRIMFPVSPSTAMGNEETTLPLRTKKTKNNNHKTHRKRMTHEMPTCGGSKTDNEASAFAQSGARALSYSAHSAVRSLFDAMSSSTIDYPSCTTNHTNNATCGQSGSNKVVPLSSERSVTAMNASAPSTVRLSIGAMHTSPEVSASFEKLSFPRRSLSPTTPRQELEGKIDTRGATTNVPSSSLSYSTSLSSSLLEALPSEHSLRAERTAAVHNTDDRHPIAPAYSYYTHLCDEVLASGGIGLRSRVLRHSAGTSYAASGHTSAFSSYKRNLAKAEEAEVDVTVLGGGLSFPDLNDRCFGTTSRSGSKNHYEETPSSDEQRSTNACTATQTTAFPPAKNEKQLATTCTGHGGDSTAEVEKQKRREFWTSQRKAAAQKYALLISQTRRSGGADAMPSPNNTPAPALHIQKSLDQKKVHQDEQFLNAAINRANVFTLGGGYLSEPNNADTILAVTSLSSRFVPAMRVVGPSKLQYFIKGRPCSSGGVERPSSPKDSQSLSVLPPTEEAAEGVPVNHPTSTSNAPFLPPSIPSFVSSITLSTPSNSPSPYRDNSLLRGLTSLRRYLYYERTLLASQGATEYLRSCGHSPILRAAVGRPRELWRSAVPSAAALASAAGSSVTSVIILRRRRRSSSNVVGKSFVQKGSGSTPALGFGSPLLEAATVLAAVRKSFIPVVIHLDEERLTQKAPELCALTSEALVTMRRIVEEFGGEKVKSQSSSEEAKALGGSRLEATISPQKTQKQQQITQTPSSPQQQQQIIGGAGGDEPSERAKNKQRKIAMSHISLDVESVAKIMNKASSARDRWESLAMPENRRASSQRGDAKNNAPLFPRFYELNQFDRARKVRDSSMSFGGSPVTNTAKSEQTNSMDIIADLDPFESNNNSGSDTSKTVTNVDLVTSSSSSSSSSISESSPQALHPHRECVGEDFSRSAAAIVGGDEEGLAELSTLLSDSEEDTSDHDHTTMQMASTERSEDLAFAAELLNLESAKRGALSINKAAARSFEASKAVLAPVGAATEDTAASAPASEKIDLEFEEVESLAPPASAVASSGHSLSFPLSSSSHSFSASVYSNESDPSNLLIRLADIVDACSRPSTTMDGEKGRRPNPHLSEGKECRTHPLRFSTAPQTRASITIAQLAPFLLSWPVSEGEGREKASERKRTQRTAKRVSQKNASDGCDDNNNHNNSNTPEEFDEIALIFKGAVLYTYTAQTPEALWGHLQL